MTATEYQQRTARVLMDWWNLTGQEHFLYYAMKTVALFDKEGRRGIFEEQCRKLHSRLSVPRKQIEFKRRFLTIVVDIQDGWFDSDGRWIGKDYDVLCLEAIHSSLLLAYGLK